MPGGSTDFTRGEGLEADSVRVGLYFRTQKFDDIFRGDEFNDTLDDQFHAYARQSEVSLSLAWQIDPEIRLDFLIPYRDMYSRSTRANGVRRSANDSGLGDIRTLVIWNPWADDVEEGHECSFFDEHHLTLYGGLKLPTGEDTRDFGNFQDYAQTGTGTLDVIFGLTYAPPITDWMRLFVGATTTLPVGQSTSVGFTPGNSIQPSVGLSFRPTSEEFDWLTFYTSMDFTFTEGNSGGTNAAARRDSGGTFVDVRPGFVVDFGDGWGMEASVSVPLHREVRGRQLVGDEIYSVGFFKTF